MTLAGLYLAVAAAYFVAKFRENSRSYFDDVRLASRGAVDETDLSASSPRAWFLFALFIVGQSLDAISWPIYAASLLRVLMLGRIGRREEPDPTQIGHFNG